MIGKINPLQLEFFSIKKLNCKIFCEKIIFGGFMNQIDETGLLHWVIILKTVFFEI